MAARSFLGWAVSTPLASAIVNGLMSMADFTKLAGIAPGATASSTAVTAPITNSGSALLPNIGIPAAAVGVNGYMAGTDKVILDGIGQYQESILGSDQIPAVAGTVILSITLGAAFVGTPAYVSAEALVGDTGAAATFIASIEKNGGGGTLPNAQCSTPGANQFLPLCPHGIVPAANAGDVIRMVVYVGTNTGNQRVKSSTTNPVALLGATRLTVTRLR